MVAHSIEWLHGTLNKNIKVAKAFTGIKELPFILTACRMKPVKYMLDHRQNIPFYDYWFDEFGNSLKISNGKKRKLFITYNDLRLQASLNNISTDLYYGLSLDRVVKMSKQVMLWMGKDEDKFGQKCYLLSFLGLDDHLRSYLHWDGEWKQISSLWLGVINLRRMGQANKKIADEPLNEKDCPFPCVGAEGWLSFLPLSEDMLDALKQHEKLMEIFE